MSHEFSRRGSTVPPDRVVLTASTSEAYSLLFKLLCDPGDTVLSPRPSYPLIEYLAELDGVRLEHYRLEFHGRWTIDLDSIEARLAAKAPAAGEGAHPDQPEQSDRLGGGPCRARGHGVDGAPVRRGGDFGRGVCRLLPRPRLVSRALQAGMAR